MSATVAYGFTSFPRDARLTLDQRGYVVTCIGVVVDNQRQRLRVERQQLQTRGLPVAGIEATDQLWRSIQTRVRREQHRLAHLKWGHRACSSAT